MLEKSLNQRNVELIVADGEALYIIEQLIEETVLIPLPEPPLCSSGT
ncbi:hypothetical protein NOF64_22765 [Brucella anthropi]|uniref:Uncharacterized protein n=1 Tax=Brucella lupini TaxID=255457 RepID=A0A256GGZ7_9HYPH|nr:hypothetical protein [Brucella lupini]MCR8493585.1 hypothetical protein [Brucella anthropi]OYR26425.1 hypothetical protein CES86_3893 [Brucella lupini]